MLLFCYFCRELLKRFNISVSYLAKTHNDRLEARGVFATDRQTLKEKAFPSLSQGRFQNASFEQMIGYLLSVRKEEAKFASLTDFASEYLTPEGFQLYCHLTGRIRNYARKSDAGALGDVIKATAHFKNNFSRPDSGLSVLTRELKTVAMKYGAKLYKKEEVRVIEKNQNKQFKIITANYSVTAKRLVVAVPPNRLKQIKGSVAKKIQEDSTFKTIGLFEGFKGFAVFEKAWWQLNSTGSRYLADEQQMLSTSDCLGFIFPYRYVE